MFLQKRVINGKTYTYVGHSFRIGKKIKKVSFILHKDEEGYNEKIIERIAKERASYFEKHFQTYFSPDEIAEIETEKVFYQIFYNLLDTKSKEEILAEFVRLFLANSMELEGSTITSQLAEDIERKKKISLPDSEVQLYHNSKRVLLKAMDSEFRSVIQFKHFHKEIYESIYSHAGKFKNQVNTFGYMEKAVTIPPQEVREKLKKALQEYKKRDVYPFLRPLLFHLHYQKVHPFADGNSRLGRILLVAQMCKLNYPPLMFKGDMNFQIRETLVEYCNRNNLDFCRFSMEQYLNTSKKFWRPMIKKFLFK
ncbi:MAG: Fic family protein [Nanoarchaeota archaeon]|nr:Fic family protein [Nanoarchaeota archaeon]